MQRTFSDLEHWHKKMFEKLGWMILAIHEGNIEKVNIYLKSIKYLIKKIDDKIKITHDEDRINDLMILKQQTTNLQFFAYKSLNNPNNFNINHYK